MALAGTQGTVSFVGNSPLLTGSFSGLDTAAIIEASLAVKRIPIDRLENKISENDTRIAAFKEFVSLLSTLQSAVNGLRSPPGSSGILNNVFEQKSAFVSSDTTTPATDILGATATNEAVAGKYEIVVQQLAEAHKVSGSALADVSTALGVTETLTIGLAGGTTETVDITAGMTAADVVYAINAVSGTTGVRASSVKIADGDYRIVLTAEETNKAIEITGDNGGATLAALSVSADNGATFTTELQAFQPAQLYLDGIATVIERDSNEIDDLIDDVTIDLYKADVGTTITLEIENDLSAARAQIENFVTAYNDVKSFLLSQQEVSEEGEIDSAAILFGDNLLRSLGRDLGSDLSDLVSGVGSTALATLRGVGIELDADGLLNIDDGTLDANLIDKLDEVRGVFEFGFQSSSADIRLVSRSQLLEVGTFTIVDPGGVIDGTNLQVAGVDAFAVSGSTLRGLEGTIYEGMTLAYARDTSDAGAAAENITITTSTGIAESLYQHLENYVGAGDGLIIEEMNRLSALSDDYSDKILALESRLELYQTALIEKYSAMEQAIAQAQAVADQLSAFLKSGDD
ncbi:flagellar filament capping protein FliD [Pelagibius marinus]|uniref:flagellar filament capping protein FliD n=1 Tax=Pelagibius marinus TaxID=2762760 RepID=UPI001872E608|nr:flagellar filament capping protein FliD [Pelagibius marinus]